MAAPAPAVTTATAEGCAVGAEAGGSRSEGWAGSRRRTTVTVASATRLVLQKYVVDVCCVVAAKGAGLGVGRKGAQLRG